MTLDEWKAWYEKHAGAAVQDNPNFQRIFFPDRGFCELTLSSKERMVIVNQVAGDGRFWLGVIESVAQILGYHRCGAICTRRIRPYLRLWGLAVDRTQEAPDGTVYHCHQKTTGQKVDAFPQPGEPKDYYILWEV